MPVPSPGDLPDPEIKPGSPALQADSLPSEPPGKSVVTVSPTTAAAPWGEPPGVLVAPLDTLQRLKGEQLHTLAHLLSDEARI